MATQEIQVRNMFIGQNKISKPAMGGGVLNAVYLGNNMVWGSKFETIEDNYIGFDIEHTAVYMDYYNPELINVIGIMEIEFHYYFELTVGGWANIPFAGGITVPIQNDLTAHWFDYNHPTGLVLDLQDNDIYNVYVDHLTSETLHFYSHNLITYFRIKSIHDPYLESISTTPTIYVEFLNTNNEFCGIVNLKGKKLNIYRANGPNVATEYEVTQLQDEYSSENGYLDTSKFYLNSSTNNLCMNFHIRLE